MNDKQNLKNTSENKKASPKGEVGGGFHIIPAIDIIDGKCVRLTKGDYDTKKIYNENPLEVAKEFEDYGIRRLHLVDLDGAKEKKLVNIKTLEKIASNTNLQIDFGGGIQSEQDIQSVLNAGARQITVGSIAEKQPELFVAWLQKFGAEKIILGADCHNRKIATNAWADTSEIDVIDFIVSNEKQGAIYSIVTDIAKDGMLQGPSFELYKDILQKSNIKLIASGGISSMEDIVQLAAIGCEGAIVGKAIYEGRIKLAP